MESSAERGALRPDRAARAATDDLQEEIERVRSDDVGFLSAEVSVWRCRGPRVFATGFGRGVDRSSRGRRTRRCQGAGRAGPRRPRPSGSTRPRPNFEKRLEESKEHHRDQAEQKLREAVAAMKKDGCRADQRRAQEPQGGARGADGRTAPQGGDRHGRAQQASRGGDREPRPRARCADRRARGRFRGRTGAGPRGRPPGSWPPRSRSARRSRASSTSPRRGWESSPTGWPTRPRSATKAEAERRLVAETEKLKREAEISAEKARQRASREAELEGAQTRQAGRGRR